MQESDLVFKSQSVIASIAVLSITDSDGDNAVDIFSIDTRSLLEWLVIDSPSDSWLRKSRNRNLSNQSRSSLSNDKF